MILFNIKWPISSTINSFKILISVYFINVVIKSKFNFCLHRNYIKYIMYINVTFSI